jgi:hypothetical protein
MITITPRRVLAAVLLFAASSCGGDGGNAKPVPLSELGSTLLDLICSRAAQCGQFPDKPTCVASNIADIGQLMADVSAGKTKYDGAAAGTCFAKVRATLSCTVSSQANAPTDPSCEQIFTGTVADGAPCFTADECVSASCDFTNCTGNACCAGACSVTVSGRVAIGGDCTAIAARCADGAFCKYTVDTATGTGTGVCAALIAEGQTCDPVAGDICVLGRICRRDPTTSVGTCSKAPATGAPCQLVEPCDDPADYCDPTTMLCTHKLAVGAACPFGNGCVDYANCDMGSQTCVARAKAGEACDASAAAPSCLGSLQCMGTCTPRPPQAVCS